MFFKNLNYEQFHLFLRGNCWKLQHDVDQRARMGAGLYSSVVSPLFCLMIQEPKGWRSSGFLRTYKQTT